MENEPIISAYLVIQDGPQAGKRVEICKDTTSIGRSRYCDLFLEDVSVHRKQASIIYNNTDYIVQDDHGSDDSFVNDTPVKEQQLQDGDTLRFGNTTLIFFSHDATRPFQSPSSRGKESHMLKQVDPNASAIGKLDLSNRQGKPLQSFDLQAEVTIGRSRHCTIFLEDLAVSRLHATIRQLADESYELEDHHSATGTFVNGRTITRCPLHEGDIVQIGSHQLTFRSSPA
ncbi:MAG: FHA domain-containing protein [Chloroflexota bacterium]|nr:FHA domain-containing protein [Chloroflexota bacterium]